MKRQDKEFATIGAFIERSRNFAIGFLNYAAVATYWTVGAFVSRRIKANAWGTKTVIELEDFLRTRYPRLKGFGRRQIYNMVDFYETYSSPDFDAVYARLKLYEFVQSPIAQIGNQASNGSSIVQSAIAQLGDNEDKIEECPAFLSLIGFTSHVRILNYCHFGIEEKVFYILYAAREHLDSRELVRCICNDTYSTVMSKQKRVTKAMKEKYPGAEFLMKDRAFLDFLKLPEKHTEHVLRKRILEHMKAFILELGKDYMYMGNEYRVSVGDSDKRLDLLFYHRGLQCLVDVELKAVPFKAEFVSKMDMYLAALDHEIKRPNENPSVGLILCPKAGQVEVQYTLDRSMSPIMIAEYRRLLIPEEVLKKELEEYCRFIKTESQESADEATK